MEVSPLVSLYFTRHFLSLRYSLHSILHSLETGHALALDQYLQIAWLGGNSNILKCPFVSNTLQRKLIIWPLLL
jgi:hypothetical protein